MTNKEHNSNGGDRRLASASEAAAEELTPICGVIRPIASSEGYAQTHWTQVGDILAEAIRAAGFEPRLVSDADNVAVIHATIVQNIFEDDIVVCDVSSRNPNVMFELGMRLAFDKPVVIVKDDETNYSFDTGVIEHIPYPKSLNYHEIGIFKDKLRKKISSTSERSKDPSFSPFLKHFRHISPKKLPNEDVPFGDFIVQRLDALDARLSRMGRQMSSSYELVSRSDLRILKIEAPRKAMETASRIAKEFDPSARTKYADGKIVILARVTEEQSRRLLQSLTLRLGGMLESATMETAASDFLSWANHPLTDEELTLATETHRLPL